MITKNVVRDMLIGDSNVDVDLRKLLPPNFQNVRGTKYTHDDRLIMAEILWLKPKKKKKSKPVEYISPSLGALAEKDDHRRTDAQHEKAISQKESRVQKEFLADSPEIQRFRKAEIEGERSTTIDVSDFDDQDLAVLDLINKVIKSADDNRGKSQKLSLNKKIREAS